MNQRKQDRRTLKFRDDLFYVCTVIERTARKIRRRNGYVVRKLGPDRLDWLFLHAGTLHSENQDEICDRLISEYRLRRGSFDVTMVDPRLCAEIPGVNDIAKVYERLVWMTSEDGETVSHALGRTYGNRICRLIDDYNGAAYYASSLALKQAYATGVFD